MIDDVQCSTSPKDGSLAGDYGSIFILLVLYSLQGIPIGLADSLPLILQNYKVTYSQQAIYSLSIWPFSLKLLWAPLVDALYFRKFGRRKSWLIPTQYLIGIVLLLLSFNIDNLLGPSSDNLTNDNNRNVSITNLDPIQTREPSVYILTAFFILIIFLCATQDITLDGWVLNLLSKRNLAYGSTCNIAGQLVGYTIGYNVFLALQSSRLCNKYKRSTPSNTGIVTLSGFVFFCGIAFIVTNTLIWIFVSEESENSDQSKKRKTLFATYLTIIKILKLKSIQLLATILSTFQIAFGITNSATQLKLVEAGISKETLALLDLPLIPVRLILPWYLSRYINLAEPLNLFNKTYSLQMICAIFYGIILLFTRKVHNPNTGSSPGYLYFAFIFTSVCYATTVDALCWTFCSFFNQISDSSIGGTYITLLTTILNLGISWTSLVSLWFIDYTTFKNCSVRGTSCNTKETIEECTKSSGQCTTVIDRYYIELTVLTIFGLIWLKWAKNKMDKIQKTPPISWKCS